MFDAFDFKLLDDPDFKEDAVREEIIGPLLKRLGYKPSGETRVVRSKSLAHPFVRIGTRKHPVTIIPDYTLWHGDTALLILDAKSPKEDVLSPDHIQQAYSYAIHPEVRAKHFALCNGRQLAVFHVDQEEPLLVLGLEEFGKRWSDVEKHLGYEYLLNPARRSYLPDLGFHVARLGVAFGEEVGFPDFHLYMIARQANDRYTCSTACRFDDRDYMATIDFRPVDLGAVLGCLAAPLLAQVRGALARAPFQAILDLMVAIDFTALLGPPTQGEHEVFRPFLLTEVLASRLDRTVTSERDPEVPYYVFSLKSAFESLQKPGA